MVLAFQIACSSDPEGEPSAASGGGGGASAGGAAGVAGSAGAVGGGAGGAGGSAGTACVDTGQRPGPRSELMGDFDAKRGRLVFFGGDDGFPKMCNPAPHQIDEVWTYDVACASFTQAKTTGGPSARARGAAAYDAAGDRLLVFGGRYRAGSSGAYTVFSDLWALDLATLTWKELATTGKGPSARSNAVAVVDPVANELVVHGGNASTNGAAFTPLGDVFTLALDTLVWTERKPAGAPKPRLFHAAALDPKSGKLYVYGGGGANAFQGPFYGDLWELSGDRSTWKELSSSGALPASRISPSLAFDAASGKLVLFGGHDDTPLGNANDTWTFDPAGLAWTQVVAPESIVTPAAGFCSFPKDFTNVNTASPDRRSASAAGFDPKASTLYVFGGKTDCGLIDDAWGFSVSKGAWTRGVKALSGEACTRRDHPEQCTSLCNLPSLDPAFFPRAWPAFSPLASSPARSSFPLAATRRTPAVARLPGPLAPVQVAPRGTEAAEGAAPAWVEAAGVPCLSSAIPRRRPSSRCWSGVSTASRCRSSRDRPSRS